MGSALLKRKELLLGLMLVLLAAAVWRNLGGGGDALGGSTAGGPGRVARPDAAQMKLFPVQWAALHSARPSYDQNGRNIFQFGVVPPPPPPPLTPAEQAAIRKAQEAAAAERAKQEALLLEQQRKQQEAIQQQQQKQAEEQAKLPPPPPPRPQPPPIPYKFIGYIGPVDHKIAVLHDGNDILFVRVGEELPKGIKVLEVGYESIKFGFTDPQFKDESRTLPMSSSY